MRSRKNSSIPRRYEPAQIEAELLARWESSEIYHFEPEHTVEEVFSIDTPPPTVSGNLHLGHVYSYSHTDFIARYKRMKGYVVLYPMGYDDNGLPTERLVEREAGLKADDLGRKEFIELCLQTSEEAEVEYQCLWKRLGLSIDWRIMYRTIDDRSRRIAQWSFIDLFRKGLIYRKKAPALWCPQCHTAIAQAELKDFEREATFYTLNFGLEDGSTLPIATTRPELLPACVALLVHPQDARARALVGHKARVPLFDHQVPLLVDENVDTTLGTGIVMCCTFGDTVDIAWWHKHDLPLRPAMDEGGRLSELASPFQGLSLAEGRTRIIDRLEASGLILKKHPYRQSVRVHERCDTPVEYLVTRQWFVRVLDFKDALLDAGRRIEWYPEHMKNRYVDWVENLHWDWCISRQRYFGVPFPLWYCDACGEVQLAEQDQLPVDPLEDGPGRACQCGSEDFKPETDVMDTWATSSLSPQIVEEMVRSRWGNIPLAPMSMRPQAHEIIRTWAFYTIVKSKHHFDSLPWKNVVISGWGLAPEGVGKISKSRGGGPMAPMEMIDLYSADAVRYWAACTGLGKDSVIQEEKIKDGTRWVTKLWNVARFSQNFVSGYSPPEKLPVLTPADRWILARLYTTISNATAAWENYDYMTAKSETEAFFWTDLADHYLEFAKQRLYSKDPELQAGACYALYHSFNNVLKLTAPILPFVTDAIYGLLFQATEGKVSVHQTSWPTAALEWQDAQAGTIGGLMLSVLSAIRRYKSEHKLSLATELEKLEIVIQDEVLRAALQEADVDLKSATRAKHISLVRELSPDHDRISAGDAPEIGLKL